MLPLNYLRHACLPRCTKAPSSPTTRHVHASLNAPKPLLPLQPATCMPPSIHQSPFFPHNPPRACLPHCTKAPSSLTTRHVHASLNAPKPLLPSQPATCMPPSLHQSPFFPHNPPRACPPQCTIGPFSLATRHVPAVSSQAYISCLKLEGLALSSDMVYVTQVCVGVCVGVCLCVCVCVCVCRCVGVCV